MWRASRFMAAGMIVVTVMMTSGGGGGRVPRAAAGGTPLVQSLLSTPGTGVAATVNLTGIWYFVTTDSTVLTGTLVLRQSGQQLRGSDGGGEPLVGSVSGNRMSFTVYGISSEDDYGGSGLVGSRGLFISGAFWDGFGGGGRWAAIKIHG